MAGKKGGASVAPKQEQKQSNMPIRVKIDKLMEDAGKLKAIASANVGEFAVHGIRVYESDKGLFVSMPSVQRTGENGEKTYEDVFHPTTKESREELFGKILDEYKQALEQSQTTTQTENNEVQVQKM